MKCPKCGYIGFEQTDRCRNCGYDFDLVGSPAPGPDLPLRGTDAGPLSDFDLGDSVPAAPARGSRRHYDADLDPRVTPPPGRLVPDLPLFDDASDDAVPIVPSAAQTPPLAVRRSTPPAVRARPRPTPRFVESEPESRLPLADVPFAPPAVDRAQSDASSAPPLGSRVLAGLVDGVLLFAVDAVVVYFTLKICRLDLSEVRVVPLAPLVAFFVLLNGGYLALLTAAGGQTLGKMAFGLRVVGGTDGTGAVPVGTSIARALLLLLAALPAGAGLLPIFFTAGRRGVHDFVAGTRVVRA